MNKLRTTQSAFNIRICDETDCDCNKTHNRQNIQQSPSHEECARTEHRRTGTPLDWSDDHSGHTGAVEKRPERALNIEYSTQTTTEHVTKTRCTA
ncbi:hypothetical protein AL065_08465 [Pseudomonas amygdali pv. ulmi]|nr:hypothetical protein AL065_08465 [Pseudomonas amygdali pv. ulmi]